MSWADEGRRCGSRRPQGGPGVDLRFGRVYFWQVYFFAVYFFAAYFLPVSSQFGKETFAR